MSEMPTINLPGSEKNNSSVEEEKIQGLEENSASTEETDIPKQEYSSAEKNSASNVIISKIPKNGINVIAIRKGFYRQKRIIEGEKFKIRRIEDSGTWMKCEDKALEKERVKFLNNRKAKN